MIARLSRTRNMGQSGGFTPEMETYRKTINWWFTGIFVVLIILPLAALAIYCSDLSSGGLMAYGAAVMVSAASCLSGGLLGFLFGIPRAQSGDAQGGSGEQRRRLIPNTNLEEVSDWLTKIIVGATLVQLGSLPRRFGELTTSVSGIFGNPSAQNREMTGAIILYSALFGFFSAYIAARSLITFLFYLSPSDWIPERHHTQAKQGSGGTEEPQVEHPTVTRSDDP